MGILTILLILSIIYIIRTRKKVKLYKKTREYQAYLGSQQQQINSLKRVESALNEQLNKLKTEEQVARERIKSVGLLVEKEFEIESAKRRDDLERTLAVELAEIQKNSPKQVLESELKEMKAQIKECRRVLQIQQAQQLKELEKENFKEFHSISLSGDDLQDIKLIREFESQLTRQEAFRKLIWTEFIQKPIQNLCKTLEVEKVSGIYKITNTKNERMYIGQAVDCASRWKEHCKTALGIGSSAFMTNKFYKAMHDEGIENFTFEVLESGAINLDERERYWIDFYNATTFGYNTKSGG
jgi:hypothetical protein